MVQINELLHCYLNPAVVNECKEAQYPSSSVGRHPQKMLLPPCFHKALHFVVPRGFRPLRYLKESVIDRQNTRGKGDGYDKE